MDPTSYSYCYNGSNNGGGGGGTATGTGGGNALLSNRDKTNDNISEWIGCGQNYLSYFTPFPSDHNGSDISCQDINRMLLTEDEFSHDNNTSQADFIDFYNDSLEQQLQLQPPPPPPPPNIVNDWDFDFLLADLTSLETQSGGIGMMPPPTPPQPPPPVIVDGDIMQQWLPTIDIFSGGQQTSEFTTNNCNNAYSGMLCEFNNSGISSHTSSLNNNNNNNNNNSSNSNNDRNNTTFKKTTNVRSNKSCPQECPICHKVLSRDLPRHMRTHEEQGRFKCPFPRSLCPHKRGQFNRQYDFKKHLLHCHFNFDTTKVKSFHDLGSKLDCSGVCKCGIETTGEEWLETHILNGVFKCPLLHNAPPDNQY